MQCDVSLSAYRRSSYQSGKFCYQIITALQAHGNKRRVHLPLYRSHRLSRSIQRGAGDNIDFIFYTKMC